MEEKVGNVQLNLTYYSGKDMYSDGDIEDKLLEIVKNNKPEQYRSIIMQEMSWPILYHLSDIRQNILDWYQFDKNSTILEIGAGCGAITGSLVNKVKKVTAIELSKKRSLINAYRNKDAKNLEIIVGNFDDISKKYSEKYDYITLIGVFEYAESYIDSTNSYELFLEKINDLLNDNGKIFIAIENRFGLKYFAGCIEDHLGMYFEGIEGYEHTSGIKTFNKNELIELFKKTGFSKYEFYYPYPDYKLPEVIYSDTYLPKPGELINNFRNFDSDRFVLFDESKVFDSIIKSDMFTIFSNSFLVVLDKKDV